MSEETSRLAFKKVVDYLSRRDHSIHELKTKMSRHFEFEYVVEAIEKAAEYDLLVEPKVLAERVARDLLTRGKSGREIYKKLLEKKLPNVFVDELKEYDNCVRAFTKYKQSLCQTEALDRESSTKIMRRLSSRGFKYDLIKKVIDENP